MYIFLYYYGNIEPVTVVHIRLHGVFSFLALIVIRIIVLQCALPMTATVKEQFTCIDKNTYSKKNVV